MLCLVQAILAATGSCDICNGVDNVAEVDVANNVEAKGTSHYSNDYSGEDCDD